MPPDESGLQEADYAGLDRRAGAFLVDVLAVYLVIGGIQLGIYTISGGVPLNWLNGGPAYEAWFLLTFSLPLWLYFTILESSARQATPGKRILKLKVVDLSGERIRAPRAFLRTILKLLPWELAFVAVLLPEPIFLDPSVVARPALFLLYFLLGLYMLAMILSPRKRGIHDLLSGTLVMRT
jgi:uncharacterized RDD family membrane protein YckC